MGDGRIFLNAAHTAILA